MGIRSSAAWPPYVGPRPRPASTPLGPGLEGSQRWQSPFHHAGRRSAIALASPTRRPSRWHKGCHTLRCCNTCRGHSDDATVHLGRQADMAIPMKTCSVLMVDDNAAMREAIARSLARRGCAVTTAVDAAVAPTAVRRQSYAIVVPDLDMHDRGGRGVRHQAPLVPP